MKILLLGVGMQGKAALHDLARNESVKEVIAVDRDLDMLNTYVANRRYGGKVKCRQADAGKPGDIDRLMALKPDVVIDLLPVGFAGQVAEAAVRHGVHLVNTFYVLPEIKCLAEEAKARDLTILPEFGMDPGIDLVLLGEAVRSLDVVEEIYCYGSGIPVPGAANNPIKYKVTWTFEGVLRAYRRPGRIIREGKIEEIKPADMFNPANIHMVDIDGLGKLEAYPNGDALKYIELLGLENANLRHMGRYTMRWPGHCEFWKKLVDLHLLDDEPVVVDGAPVDRKRFLAAAIEPHIRLGEQEQDLAIIRIEVAGRKNGKKVRVVYQMIDKRDLESGLTAMSRTVGFTAAVGALMICAGKIHKRGVLSPVNDIPFDLLVKELAKRDIHIESSLVL